jgi:hypothetical protein
MPILEYKLAIISYNLVWILSHCDVLNLTKQGILLNEVNSTTI